MINFIRGGILIDEEGWSAANPRHDRIEVYFADRVCVTLTEDFMRRALDLIEYDRNRGKQR